MYGKASRRVHHTKLSTIGKRFELHCVLPLPIGNWLLGKKNKQTNKNTPILNRSQKANANFLPLATSHIRD